MNLFDAATMLGVDPMTLILISLALGLSMTVLGAAHGSVELVVASLCIFLAVILSIAWLSCLTPMGTQLVN